MAASPLSAASRVRETLRPLSKSETAPVRLATRTVSVRSFFRSSLEHEREQVAGLRVRKYLRLSGSVDLE